MLFGKSDWKIFEKGIEKEWLVTNGIGGFASSTIIGANTRRYHGLLVAALKPPVNRHLVLSKIDESISIDGVSYNLFSYQTPDFIMKGYQYLQNVEINAVPAFIYSIGDVFLEKKVCMIYGQNTVVVTYHIINGESNCSLRLTPLVNFRDYHFNSSREHMRFSQKHKDREVSIKPYDYPEDIVIKCSEGSFISQSECYFYNMDYAVERERGLHSTEDLFIPGYFEVDVSPYEEKDITIVATIGNEIKHLDGKAYIEEEEKRIKALVDKAGYEDKLARQLVKAADNFIVYRQSTDAKTIIAGYPWFTDWGRDTMIAFAGLTLATKRFDDAREILYTFSLYVKDGLIPNVFPDAGCEPAYNTVDAPLWYFEAVSKYIEYTGDIDFIREKIYKVLVQIIEAYKNGTHFNIRMDSDHLITAGDSGTQLTWMDAKVGDWVVTPRHGKAVEINALWYNALRVMSELSTKIGLDSVSYDNTAASVKASFLKAFWNENEQCLFDVISGGFKDGKIRPNQVMAAGLTYPVIEGETAKKVVRKVWKELYAQYGLRTLSPRDKDYKGIYCGEQYYRDGAYHQGTVWAWIIGYFVSAFIKAYGDTEKSRRTAKMFITPFIDHMKDACIGSVSEIFDGNDPYIPRGCFAQAWSVGELLRCYSEDVKAK